MRILACTGYPDDEMEKCRPGGGKTEWEFVISGFWSESPYHSGNIAYYIQNTSSKIWVINEVERNTELDNVTEEDVNEVV